MKRYRFLFNRFKPERYAYAVVYLLRNTAVALVPVLFAGSSIGQIVVMTCILTGSLAFQCLLWPWRTMMANTTDACMTFCLVVVIVIASFLIPVSKTEAESSLSVMLIVALSLCVVYPMSVISYALCTYMSKAKKYGCFLCHAKGSAGVLARFLKILLERRVKTQVFLDSDQLEDLGMLLDSVRCETKNLVVLQSGQILSRMWCAAEIVTAAHNRVPVVPLHCDGYVQPDEEMLLHLDEVWNSETKHLLMTLGISLEMVAKAYRTFREYPAVEMPRAGTLADQEKAVDELVGRCRQPRRAFGATAAEGGHAQILITTCIQNMEALSSCFVLGSLVQQKLQIETRVIFSPTGVRNMMEDAEFLCIMLSQGILNDIDFAAVFLEACLQKLDFVLVSIDTTFDFPSNAFFARLERQGFGPEGNERLARALTEAARVPGSVQLQDTTEEVMLKNCLGESLARSYRALFGVLSLPLTVLGSQALIERQIAEICRRRFHRYAKIGENSHSNIDRSSRRTSFSRVLSTTSTTSLKVESPFQSVSDQAAEDPDHVEWTVFV